MQMVTSNGKRRLQPLDIEIGARIRARRRETGLSQDDIAQTLGVTAQQVQKYERGENRASGSTLVTIARALNVTVSELVGENETAAAGGAALELKGAPELLDLYSRLQPDVREHFLGLVRAMANGQRNSGRG